MPISAKRRIKLLSVGLALSCIFLPVKPIQAHPADMFFQSYSLQLSAKSIQYVLKKQRQPQVWLLNVQTGELQLVASPGSWPAWLPD